jgi:hypothetical protein
MTDDTQLETQAEIAAPSLNLTDIAMSANVIDIAFQRGAFKAAEAKDVGAHYEKLTAFIEYMEANKEEGQ